MIFTCCAGCCLYNNSYHNAPGCVCGAGSYKMMSGSDTTEHAWCEDCPAGRVEQYEGPQTSCGYFCDNGAYSNAGQSVCTLCDAGKYTSYGVPHSACTDCEVGRFLSEGGNLDCGTCTTGYYSGVNGSTVCSDCTGQHNVNWNHCCLTVVSFLAAGYFTSDNSMSACTACVPGTINDHDRASLCSGCGTGKFQNMSAQASGEFSIGNPTVGLFDPDCLCCRPSATPAHQARQRAKRRVCLSCVEWYIRPAPEMDATSSISRHTQWCVSMPAWQDFPP